MTKSIPVKGWVSILFNTMAFCLLCFVGNVANAQSPENPVPGAETGVTETPSLEIAFAKVSGKVGNSTKTAGCLAVWSASETSTPNIYCRYELGISDGKKFLRDDDVGINLSNITLYYSNNKKAFRQNIKTWFKNKYPKQSLLEHEITLMVTVMSNLVDKLSMFGSQQPKIYSLELDEELSGDGNGLAINKKFAASVHTFLAEKVNKIRQDATAAQQAQKEKPEQNASATPPPTEKVVLPAPHTHKLNFLNFPKEQLALLGLSIVIILLVMFALLGFLLIKKIRYSEYLFSENISRTNTDIYKKLQIQQTRLQQCVVVGQLDTLRSEQEKRHQHLEQELANLQQQFAEHPLLSLAENTGQPLSKKLQESLAENRKLEQRAAAIHNKLRLEQEQHKNTKKNLEDSKDKLEKSHGKFQKVEDNLQQTQKKLDTVSRRYEAELREHQKAKNALTSALAELNTVSQKYETEQGEHQKAENALTDAQREIETLTNNKQVLQEVLRERFRLIKPETTDFSHWMTDMKNQPGIWRWLQPAFVGELLACETIINDISVNGTKNDQEILELSYLDTLLKDWDILVSKLFKSDTELWTYLRDIDGGKWLNHLLRADDLLQTYFPGEPKLTLLSEQLSNVTGLLRAMFKEHGVEFRQPKLLEEVPDYIPQKSRMPGNFHPNLRALVKQQVQERAHQTKSQFLVDIEMYGFVTAENPNADVRVWVYNPSEWR